MHAGDADALDEATVAATLDAPNSDSEMVSSDSDDAGGVPFHCMH